MASSIKKQNGATYGAVGVQYTPASNRNVVDEVLNKIGCGVFQIIAFLLAAITTMAFLGESLSLGYINLQLTEQWKLTDLKYATLCAVPGATNIIGAPNLSN